MRTGQDLRVFVLMGVGLALAGCRSRAPAAAADRPGAQMSPQGNAAGGSRAALRPAPEEVPSAADEPSWPTDEAPAVGPPDGAVGDGGAAAAGLDGRVPVDGGVSPQLLARRAVDDEVDRLLHGLTDRLLGCFGRQAGPRAEARLRIRVHRSGYVMAPEVSGADDAVRACLAGVVSGLRVTQPLADSVTLERTLRTQRRRP